MRLYVSADPLGLAYCIRPETDSTNLEWRVSSSSHPR